MLNDYKNIDTFLQNYFNSENNTVLLTIHQMSKNLSHSKAFYKFLRNKIKKLINYRINSINEENVFKEYEWIINMIQLFKKIFREIKNIYKIEKEILSLFKHRVLSLKTLLINLMSSNYVNKKFNNFDKFLHINNYFGLGFKELLEVETVQRLVIYYKDYSIADLEKSFEYFNDDFLQIQDKVLFSLSNLVDEFNIFSCLQEKENIEFLNKLFTDNKIKYKEIILTFLQEKYSYNSLVKITDENLYVNIILAMYKEYKEVDQFIKTVFVSVFKGLDINYEYFVNSLDCVTSRSTDLYEFSGIIYNFISEKEMYEQQLRKTLCFRLINNITTVEEEEKFINLYKVNAGDVYSYKMLNILEDFKKRIIFNNSEIMMIRKFQWAEFENTNVFLKSLDNLKKKYEDEIAKFERKKIIWMDLLSSVDVEIFNKNFTLSLLQYKILLNLNNKEYIRNLDYLHKKELNILLEYKLVVLKDDNFYLNEDCEGCCLNINKHSIVKNKSEFSTELTRDCTSEVLDSKIMLQLKKNKTLKISQLNSLAEQNRIFERLDILEKKGFCKIEEDTVSYCP
ncbi:hypothetical protein NCER_100868 [Vairimorpha ceranae BRL01]|uniref:Cullin family profile domain-containing protein n=2 Tax=Vairimorpha ceranae TaxID=40302 RepID=C4V8N6_VAIC1|nr:hypothetical protein AAJ76_590004284 [Vairimorpha ceranae]EEQ82414.1 hypothetical protein NCER_100868 [Vairimorpha ceranae BRL01]KAF5140573.1 hypothetical protein G9O61_00g013780 [Vairimorpha ceranae]KKO74564.1 hypothetical protein AAJ76_590004284 [Vairimorpha ceranae]